MQKQLGFFDYPDPVQATAQSQVREVLNMYAPEQKLLAGIFGRNGTEIVRKLFDAFPSMQLIANADITELAAVIGKEAAEKLTAIMVLSQGIFKKEIPRIRHSADVFELMKPYAAADKEHFWVITLSTRMTVLGVHHIYTGSINAIGNVRIAELLRPAIVMNANSIILVHNHPTGDTTPSPQDLNFTRTIHQTAKDLDIQVLDHIVIGNGYHSIKEKNKSIF